MDFTTKFENELIKAYVETYGQSEWESKTEKEKSETLHELLVSFLAVAARK